MSHDNALEDKKTIEFPHLALWMMRLLRNNAFLERVLEEPLLFGLAYATTSPHMEWPVLHDAAQAAAESVASEALLKTVHELGRHLQLSLGGDFAHRFNVGVVAFTYFNRHPDDFFEHFETNRDLLQLEQTLDRYLELIDTPSARTVRDIGKLLGLSPLQKELLLFAVGISLSPDFCALVTAVGRDAVLKKTIWPSLFDATPAALKEAFSEESVLVKSGLLRGSKKLQVPRVSPFFLDFIVEDTDQPLRARLLKPLAPKKSAGSVARITDEDQAILERTLARHGQSGVNVLLYSAKDVERLNFVAELLRRQNLEGVVVQSKDVPDSDLQTLTFLAQQVLAQERTPGVVLVVDRAHHILTAVRMTAVGFFFGREHEEDDDLSTLDEVLLTENAVPAIWLTSQAARIAEEGLARFLFHCELKKASQREKRERLEASIQALALPEEVKAELIKHEGLSEQQLQSAMALAETLGLTDPREHGRVLCRAIERSQLALNRKNKDAFRKPITHYSLEYLNTGGRFGPKVVLEALKTNTTASLCFYGAPGTGKTQLAEYIALELGKPLIMKRASDLLDKYVGGTEKQIAEMFAEAEAEDAVLMLDEADTFLRDRTFARHSWEVSSVNELLQRMERFQGIFICATNLMNQVDQAALRRFTFKLSFHPLTDAQRWKMFVTETGMASHLEDFSAEEQARMQEDLLFIIGLTPGDFATVKRQCKLLGQQLTPDEWLEQLKIEAQLRQRENPETA